MITLIIHENDWLIIIIQLISLILRENTAEIKIAFSRHLELRISIKKEWTNASFVLRRSNYPLFINSSNIYS